MEFGDARTVPSIHQTFTQTPRVVASSHTFNPTLGKFRAENNSWA